MTRNVIAVLLAVTLAGCATPPDAPGARYPEPAGELPPARRPAPVAPFSSETALLADRVAEALERRDKDRWERFLDAMDRGELANDLRLKQEDVDAGKWKLEWLFQNGDELFEHDFGDGEGFGPGRLRVHLGPGGGPDALSCAECHHRGGFDGAGERSQNAFFDGDGKDPSSAFERNAPHTLGLGHVQRLGEQMTQELTAKRDGARLVARDVGKPIAVPLFAMGLDFGTLVVNPDGTVDAAGVKGVSDDLVVRPFGWKGSLPTLREFAADGFQRHHGIQLSIESAIGKGPAHDRDGDGRPNEITEGMVTSVTTYLSLLEIPVMIPPRDPVLLGRHASGMDAFERIGCASCHVPSLPLFDTKLVISPAVTADLIADGEAPQPRKDVYTDGVGIPIFLYSDLKRHDMGPALAEARPTVQGIPGSVFLTRPLWGLADTGPWLHDGRAATLDEAILLHGGEAQKSRDAFAALSKSEKADLRIFLLSLTRYPRIEYR